MDKAWVLISDLLATDLDVPKGKFQPNFGGHTGAFTGIMTATDGREFFIKWSSSGNSFARDGLAREISIHRWLPAMATQGTGLIAVRTDAYGTAAAFGVNRNPAVVRWTDRTLLAAIEQLKVTSAALRLADAPIGLPDVGARLTRVLNNPQSPWFPMVNEFTEMAFDDAYCDDICHSDLHRGNVLVSPSNQTTFIDWAWAGRMPSVFDSVMLAADAALDGHNIYRIAQMMEADPFAFRLALGTYAALLELMPPANEHASTRARKKAIVTESLRRGGLIRS